MEKVKQSTSKKGGAGHCNGAFMQMHLPRKYCCVDTLLTLPLIAMGYVECQPPKLDLSDDNDHTHIIVALCELAST